MNPAIREAIRAVDEACPEHYGDPLPRFAECSESHAAIRNLARTVRDEAAKAIRKKSGMPSAFEDAVLALMPEEVKQHE